MIANDEVAGWVAGHPNRFAGIAAVDLAKPMDAVGELRRCITELGFIGLRVIPWLWEAPPTDRRYYPLYAACVELGVPFRTQVGHTGPMRPSETGRPIPYIDQVAIDFPELVIVGGHIGYPWTEERVAVPASTRTSRLHRPPRPYTAKRYPPELVRYMTSRGGRRKVMFGSNYPMIAPNVALEELDALGLDEETRELFLEGQRAAGLWPRSRPPGGVVALSSSEHRANFGIAADARSSTPVGANCAFRDPNACSFRRPNTRARSPRSTVVKY